MCIPDTSCVLRPPSPVVAYNIAKVQNIRCIASSLKVLWYGSIEWNMEENLSMEWKIFTMERKWNGRKLPEWNTEKSSLNPFHTMPCSDASTVNTCWELSQGGHKFRIAITTVLLYSQNTYQNIRYDYR